METTSVTILGARGSVPVSDPACARYGGATTSILLRLAGQYVLIDAGTGILRLPAEVLEQAQLPLLMTHAHLDHLNGLSMCPYVQLRDRQLDIYADRQDGADLSDVLERLYSPPVWPILPKNFAARLTYHAVSPEFHIGAVSVQSMAGVHPGGVTLYRLNANGKSIVVITDCTLTEALYPHAVAFAKNCDILLCDGQYSDEEWALRSGFGHNKWSTAARLGADCGAKTVRIVHHDPTHTDSVLDAAAEEVRAIHPNCTFAHEGEVIGL